MFVDANETLAGIVGRLHRQGFELTVNPDPAVKSETFPELLSGTEIVIIDHSYLPTDVARRCVSLKHVVFLGTGPRSYMNPDELAELGIEVHIVKGYGDIAVAEHTLALIFAAARGLTYMDREMRAGEWRRTDGLQLRGKTLGIVGFGSIAAEVARMARGIGMEVNAWNRTPKSVDGVRFLSLDEVIAGSDVLSLNLTLNDETRGIISRERIAALKPGALLVNTARAALVDEEAMIEALRSGHLRHVAMDVFLTEPLPVGNVLTTLPNITLSAHSAFRTPEASEALIEIAIGHCRRLNGLEA